MIALYRCPKCFEDTDALIGGRCRTYGPYSVQDADEDEIMRMVHKLTKLIREFKINYFTNIEIKLSSSDIQRVSFKGREVVIV